MNDFSRFITAILEDDQAAMNRYAQEVTRVLTDFLMIHFQVKKADAEDCAQNVLLMVISKTKAGELTPDKPPAYMLISARNEYFRLYKDQKRNGELPDHDLIESPLENPGELLVSKELKDILYYCIGKLSAGYQKLVLYMLKNPDEKAEGLARELNTSVNNIWTRKHRLNQKLMECMKKKI
ncbi:RNA polymerase sigma factor [Cyclonatronum proteinivorum]|nr:sigma-70 family RNA polymerase sigma factor [Cyclonatronum proteinivorum]